MFLKERNHQIIEQLRSHQSILTVVGLGKSHLKLILDLAALQQEGRGKPPRLDLGFHDLAAVICAGKSFH